MELVSAKNAEQRVEELADILEVAQSLASASKLEWHAVVRAAEMKRASRGSFQDRIVLLETSLPQPAGARDRAKSSGLDISLEEMAKTQVAENVASIPFARLLLSLKASPIELRLGNDNYRLVVKIEGGGIRLTVAPGQEGISKVPIQLELKL